LDAFSDPNSTVPSSEPVKKPPNETPAATIPMVLPGMGLVDRERLTLMENLIDNIRNFEPIETNRQDWMGETPEWLSPRWFEAGVPQTI